MRAEIPTGHVPIDRLTSIEYCCLISVGVEIQQEDPSENYAPTLGWILRLFLVGSLFLDDEKILFIDDVYL
jgi:hypothetical protein